MINMKCTFVGQKTRSRATLFLTTILVSVYSCECLPLRYNTRRWRILWRWCVHHGPHRCQHSCRECVPRLRFLCMYYVYYMYTMVYTDASIPVGSVSRVYDFYVRLHVLIYCCKCTLAVKIKCIFVITRSPSSLTFHIFDSTKIYRKKDLKVIYQVRVFGRIGKPRWPPLVSD